MIEFEPDAELLDGQHRLERFSSCRISIGREFLHKRLINEAREPELCRVTKIDHMYTGQVWYRVGVDMGEGALRWCELKYFRTEVLKEWTDGRD